MQHPKKIMTHKAPRDIMGVTTQPKRRSNMCHYTHFTTEERELSRVLQAQGLSIRAIARMLNRSPSSVSREFKRNSYSDGTYSAHHADKLYRKRRKNCGRKPKLKSGAAREYVLAKMALRWSPEQIAGRAKRDK